MSNRTVAAGAKDNPVTIQWKDSSKTASGGVKETFDPPAREQEMMASRQDSHGGEGFEGDQKTATAKVSWRIWYRDDVTTADCRVVDDFTGEVYEVLSVIQIGRRQELELLTEWKDNRN